MYWRGKSAEAGCIVVCARRRGRGRQQQLRPGVVWCVWPVHGVGVPGGLRGPLPPSSSSSSSWADALGVWWGVMRGQSPCECHVYLRRAWCVSGGVFSLATALSLFLSSLSLFFSRCTYDP